MTRIDPTSLADHLARYDAVPPTDLGEHFGSVIDALGQLFPDIDGAGVMTLDQDGDLRCVAADDHAGAWLEDVQATTGTGPCVDVMLQQEVVSTTDLGTDDRWPELTPHLLPNGVRAVLGAPIRMGSLAVGSLNVYSNRATDWDPSEIRAVQALADVMQGVIALGVESRRQDVLVGQLQTALETRVSIERAIGLLMGRHDLDAGAAFNRLRAAARSERRAVSAVANELLDGKRVL
jgi:GAF domain-containing protein